MLRCYGGKNYPQNLLEKVKQLHYSNYSNYSKQNKQEQILKKSFHGYLEERNVLVQGQEY